MASKTISDLDALAGTATAPTDQIVLWDASASVSKKVAADNTLTGITNATVLPSGAVVPNTLIVQQPGGTPGTDQVNISHDGTDGHVVSNDGKLFLDSATHDVWIGDSTDCVVQHSSTRLYVGLASGIVLGNNAGTFKWSDVGLSRGVASVLTPTDGASGPGWIQNSAGESCLSSAFTRNDATLTVTNLSRTVIAGRSYRITGCLQVSNTTAAEGVQFDFAGGTATAATFFMGATAMGSVTPGTVTSASLAGVINYSVVTGTDLIHFNGFLKADVGGTFILRAAENTTALGTVTLGAGSWMELEDTVPL